MIEDILNDTINRFNGKVATDEKLRSDLTGISRSIVLRLDDGRRFNFQLSDCHVGKPNIGDLDKPDISIESDEATLEALYKKELRPMKAFAMRKIRIDSSVEDLLRLRKFF
jgi:putative sterol carrier protein